MQGQCFIFYLVFSDPVSRLGDEPRPVGLVCVDVPCLHLTTPRHASGVNVHSCCEEESDDRVSIKWEG